MPMGKEIKSLENKEWADENTFSQRCVGKTQT